MPPNARARAPEDVPQDADPTTLTGQALSRVVRDRLTKARAELVMDAPFFGFLALRLKLVEDPAAETMWTDGVSIGYNPAFVLEITGEELKGVFCHEVLHVSNGHCWRMGSREPEAWNLACDYAINPLVFGAKFRLPDDGLFDPAYRGLSAERIYDLRKLPPQPRPPASAGGPPPPDGEYGADAGGGSAAEDPTAEPGQGAGQGSPTGQGPPPSGDGPTPPAPGTGPQTAPPTGAPRRGPAGEVRPTPAGTDPRQLEDEWKVAVNQAAMSARMRGNLPADLERTLPGILKPRVDWRTALREFYQQAHQALDYRWRCPSPRYLAQGLYLPQLKGETMPPIAVFSDTSASIHPVMLAAFRAEIEELVAESTPEAVYVGFADAAVARVNRFDAGEALTYEPVGGGGTDFRPVFDWVEQEGIDLACLIYFTDLEGTFPETPPAYPVLWVSPPTNLTVPWGQLIEMRD